MMFTHYGFEVYIALGKRGYPCNKYWRHSIFGNYDDEKSPPKKGPNGFSMDDSPWTQARYDYASQFGIVVETPNPGEAGSDDTLSLTMDILKDYDRLLLGRGDMLLSFDFLERIVTELPWPSMYGFKPGHAYFLLDRGSAVVYQKLTKPWIQEEWGHPRGLKYRYMSQWMPDGHPYGTGTMAKAGITVYGGHNCTWPNKIWMDIDIPEQYEQALRWVADERLAWPK